MIENIGNGMNNIDLGVRIDGMVQLIDELQRLEGNPDQHFHISSNFAGACRIGKITFYENLGGDRESCIVR